MGTLIGVIFFIFHAVCVYYFFDKFDYGLWGVVAWFVSYWTFGIIRNWDAILVRIDQIRKETD